MHTQTDTQPCNPPACAAGRWVGILAVLAFALLTAVSLPACRTTEGLGRDVEHLGDNVADSAERHTP